MRYKTAILEPVNDNFYFPHKGIPPEKCFGDDWYGAAIIDSGYVSEYDGEWIDIQFLLHPRWSLNMNGVNDAVLMAVALHLGQPNVDMGILEDNEFYSIEDVFNHVTITNLRTAGIIMIAKPYVPVNYFLTNGGGGPYMLSAPYPSDDEDYFI